MFDHHVLCLAAMAYSGMNCCHIAAQTTDAQAGNSSVVPSAYRVTGEPLFAATPSAVLVAKSKKYAREYGENPDDPDALIWHGRFLAYQGKYRDAIDVYTRGIQQFPDDARMLRHRGHRYITVRQFDKAIADLSGAAQLIEGQPNAIEPDGMPNPKNIPISTLHGNIYYHLGLAYYLKHDWPNALMAYRKCLDVGTNDDNVVSATHWIYMIQRRMGDDELAVAALAVVQAEMNIVENFGYHRACLFYKEELSMDDLLKGHDDRPAADAVSYAIANWHFCNGDHEAATAAWKQLVAGPTWASFGHIAAEVDLAAMREGESDDSKTR